MEEEFSLEDIQAMPDNQQDSNQEFSLEELQGNPIINKIKDPEKGSAALSATVDSAKTMYEKLSDIFAKPFQERKKNIEEIGASSQSMPSKVFQAAGQGAAVLGDIGFNAAKAVIKPEVKQAVKSGIQKIAETPVAQKAGEGYSSLKQKYPEATGNIEAGLNIASVIPTIKGAEIVGKAGGEVLKTGAREGLGVAAKIAEKQAVKKSLNIEKEANNLANTIVRGNQEDITKAKDILTSINPKEIKTYSQLENVLQTKADTMINAVDNVLLNDKNLYKSELLALSKKVGEKTVSKDFVSEALNHLKENYTKINDISNAERISQKIEELSTKGITLQDVNNIAKEYGSEFGKSAFSKTGEPLKGISSQSAENVRSGLKDTIREIHPAGKTLKTLDEQASEIIRTKDLVSEIKKGVNKLQAKIKEEPTYKQVGKTIGKAAGRTIDVLSAGSLRGFLTSFLPSNIGNKVMNFLDIEKSLNNNLKKLNELNSVKSSELPKMLRKLQSKFK